MTENEADAYLTVVEGWLRDNRGIVFTEGAVNDLCGRIATVLAEVARLRADSTEAHRKLNAIAEHPDVPLLIKQYARGALDGRALEPKP